MRAISARKHQDIAWDFEVQSFSLACPLLTITSTEKYCLEKTFFFKHLNFFSLPI